MKYIGYYNFIKFHQNQMKNKKGLLIACFSVQNFKVSVESWKSYIVQMSFNVTNDVTKMITKFYFISHKISNHVFPIYLHNGICWRKKIQFSNSIYSFFKSHMWSIDNWRFFPKQIDTFCLDLNDIYLNCLPCNVHRWEFVFEMP